VSTDLSGRERPEARHRDWVRCPQCGDLIYLPRFLRNLRVCPGCGRHERVTAPDRIEQLLDADSARPVQHGPTVVDPLGFVDRLPYAERLRDTRRRTGLDEAVICVQGEIEGEPVVLVVMDFGFLGGSLGCDVGERIAAAARVARLTGTPLVMVTASGGARMQEGPLALMQMVKTTQAVDELGQAGLLTVTVVTDPTYGGVAASFATQADVILAEPGAHLGFAGPRVIAQTIGGQLPPNFQTAEFLHERGLIDAVIPRHALRATLAQLLAAVRSDPAPVPLPAPGSGPAPDSAPAAGSGPAPAEVIDDPGRLIARDPWEVVRTARRTDRPTTLDYARLMLDGFWELHGDRYGADSGAIVGGVGRLGGRPVMLIGHQKAHSMQELVARNFGMPEPSGYRKAVRLMRLAARLRLPVITLIDTPGAYPGVDAERDGQAWAVADSLRVMSTLPVPVVAVITGEGGSGGALALGVADRVLALESAVYSVISPEGCAAILWRDTAMAGQAARTLQLEPRALLRHGVIDGVVGEPLGGAHRDHASAADRLGGAVLAALATLDPAEPERLLARRRDRFAAYGALDGDTVREEKAA
jgi:acetyl-CoA carboxylase carboxyl transferase subunit beta